MFLFCEKEIKVRPNSTLHRSDPFYIKWVTTFWTYSIQYFKIKIFENPAPNILPFMHFGYKNVSRRYIFEHNEFTTSINLITRTNQINILQVLFFVRTKYLVENRICIQLHIYALYRFYVKGINIEKRNNSEICFRRPCKIVNFGKYLLFSNFSLWIKLGCFWSEFTGRLYRISSIR